jgi:hypothetical protein
MALPELEANDIISTKDGQSLRILTIYKNGNEVSKIDGIDDNSPSPMRVPVFANNIARIMKKHKEEPVKKGDKK